MSTYLYFSYDAVSFHEADQGQKKKKTGQKKKKAKNTHPKQTVQTVENEICLVRWRARFPHTHVLQPLGYHETDPWGTGNCGP